MANRMLGGLAVVVVASLTACANPYTSYWDKPGASPGEWEQVKAACMLEGAREVPSRLPIP